MNCPPVSRLRSSARNTACDRWVVRAKGFDGTATKAADAPPLQWASELGCDLDKVTLGKFKGLRGLKATAVIATDEVFASVPRSCALWTTARAPCPFPKWIDAAFFKAAPWYVKLSLMVLHERRLGSEAKLSQYIALLPDSVDLPCFWTPSERDQLHSASLRAAIEEQAAQWNGYYTQLMASSPACGVSHADFTWAMSCVSSRTFTGPYIGSSVQDRLNLLALVAFMTATSLTLGLFPEDRTLTAAASTVVFNFVYELALSSNAKQYAMCLIDMANYDATLDTELSYSYFQDAFQVAAGRQFNRGDQIYVSYGRQTSDSLLLKYGFVVPALPGDRYTFGNFRTLLCEACEVAPERLAALDADTDAAVRGALGSVTLSELAQVEDGTKAALRFVLGLAESVQEGGEKVSNARDVRLWDAVLAVCRLELERLPSTLQRDKRELKAAGRLAGRLGGEREVTALMYNVQKKTFLVERIANLELRISKMA